MARLRPPSTLWDAIWAIGLRLQSNVKREGMDMRRWVRLTDNVTNEACFVTV